MNCAVVVQTCDKYEKFWDGFFFFMEKHWSKGIKCPIYFCNEEKTLRVPKGYTQLKTGKGTFIQNLQFILETVKEDNVFYMLEDFWPAAPMRRSMFDSLYKAFTESRMDALQVSSYTPYYDLEVSDLSISGKNLLKFKPDSEWIFNLQARFWRKTRMMECLCEPEISESVVSSAITAEMASDEVARKQNKNLQVWLLHYLWYPITGVAYRGEFTEVGQQMKNVLEIENFVNEKFSLQASF